MVSAQNKLSQRLGHYISHTLESHRLIIQSNHGALRVSAVKRSVFRIEVAQETFRQQPEYAVIHDVVIPFDHVNVQGDSICILNDSVELIIEKSPLRLIFKDMSGTILNEDDPLGVRWIGAQVTNYKKLEDGEKFIGLGEKTGPLNRRGLAYQNWNDDNYGYAIDDDPVYSSTPFYMGIHQESVYGVYLNNTFRTTFNFGASNDRFSSFGAEDGNLDYYFFGSGSVAKIIEDYTWLTGRMELPPLWSLGYHQSRWSYFPDSEVLGLARTFRDKKLPADVIHLDIHYMDAYKLFTWDQERFPEPKAMIDKLKAMGFHVVVIVDPGIKTEKGYEVYEEGLKKSVFVKYPDNENYAANVWPGRCHFPDFTSAYVREWWGRQFQGLVAAGVEGFWNDMNEPASWGNRPPDLIEFEMEGEKGTHLEAHNLYGMQMARATKEGVDKLRNERSFVLTRAAFAGIQRFAAKWTGDNVASDEHMLLSARMICSMGLSGVAFAGPDIGGFTGERTPKLFARWISQGTFTPFFRNHAAHDTTSHEPWAYGEWCERISRKYLELRYQLMPYIYSIFKETSVSGMPIARSLAIDYTFDDVVYKPDFQNQYLFGPALMVAPVISTQDYAKVYLPEGDWYDFRNDQSHEGGQTIITPSPLDDLPVFVRYGAIIPRQSTVQHSMASSEVLEIHVYVGAAGAFSYYEDDGVSRDYTNGQYQRTIHLTADGGIRLSKVEGNFMSKYKKLKLIWHSVKGTSEKQISLDAGEIMLEQTQGNRTR